jgi:hypothetical protein
MGSLSQKIYTSLASPRQNIAIGISFSLSGQELSHIQRLPANIQCTSGNLVSRSGKNWYIVLLLSSAYPVGNLGRTGRKASRKYTNDPQHHPASTCASVRARPRAGGGSGAATDP